MIAISSFMLKTRIITIKACLLYCGLFASSHALSSIRALHTAATGMATQEDSVNTISHNVANTGTIGFKKSRTESEDLHYQTVIEAGGRSSSATMYSVGVQIGAGSRTSATRKIFEPGSPQITNRPFDLMISGDGFFGIIMPNGELKYGRDGSFNVDATGTMVTNQGYKLYPTIVLPPGTLSVNISDSGVVEAFLNGQVQPLVLGSIPIFTFVNQVGLKSTGQNLYQVTTASGPPMELKAGTNNAGGIMQGSLELSNVSIMNEMTDLIRAQRAYEMNSKVMGVADRMLETVNNIR